MDESAERSQGGLHLGHRRLDGRGVRHVHHRPVGGHPVPVATERRRLLGASLIEVPDGDGPAHLGQGQRRLAADTRAASGDQDAGAG